MERDPENGRFEGLIMPTIASFDGILIYMYWQEHGIPHLHAVHGDRTAVYSIESGEIIVGALRRRAKRLVKTLDRRAPRGAIGQLAARAGWTTICQDSRARQ